MTAFSGIFLPLLVGISEKKVSGNFCRLRGAGGYKKVRKKKFFMEFFPCGFSISGIKKGGEVNSFRFAIRVEGKCEINLKKKKSVFPLQGAFSLFFVVNLPEKMFRKCFGGKEKK